MCVFFLLFPLFPLLRVGMYVLSNRTFGLFSRTGGLQDRTPEPPPPLGACEHSFILLVPLGGR